MPDNDYMVSDILRGAADYMARHVLVKGDYYSDEFGNTVDGSNRHKIHGCCARGAIYEAAKKHAGFRGNRIDLGDMAIARAEEYLGGDLDDYNDEPETTKDDVVDVLRAAATGTQELDGLFAEDPEDW